MYWINEIYSSKCIESMRFTSWFLDWQVDQRKLRERKRYNTYRCRWKSWLFSIKRMGKISVGRWTFSLKNFADWFGGNRDIMNYHCCIQRWNSHEEVQPLMEENTELPCSNDSESMRFALVNVLNQWDELLLLYSSQNQQLCWPINGPSPLIEDFH